MIYFCRPCREPLDTAECPFCDSEATPFDEICDLALAAGSRRAKTAKPVECEASQSGPKGNAPEQSA